MSTAICAQYLTKPIYVLLILMKEHLIFVFILVGAVGIGAQWLAWRLRIPAIILLIAGGLFVGPWMGWLNPSADLGNMLDPIVALAVALILFEGGLNLRWHEYKETGVDVNRLVTVGLLLTWLLGSLAAHYIGMLSWPVAILFGAIIIVTGPTVIIPLLKQAKLKRRSASLLKWEGIINDPTGALIAVLVYEYFSASDRHVSLGNIAASLGMALSISIIVGLTAGLGMGWAFRKGHVPEFLKSPVLLTSALVVYFSVNHLQEEAGLLAITVYGITLGNQKLRSIEELRRFKEYITILLVSGVFVLLTSNIDFDILKNLNWYSIALLATIIFIVRPVTIYLSTLGTGIAWQERVLLGWIAPRGIVAAAVAGLFAQRMIEKQYVGAEQLLPLVFSLIVITVVLHGFSIGWIARRLGLATVSPHGLLIVGASPWTVGLAQALQKLKVPVIVSDPSWDYLRIARMNGVVIHHGEILSERSEETLELNMVNQLLAATSNDAYNALVCTRFAPEFGRNKVFQLPDSNEHHEEKSGISHTIRGYIAFGDNASHDDLMRHHYQNGQFHQTKLSKEYTYEDYLEKKNEDSILIAAVEENGNFEFYPISESRVPKEGETIISYDSASKYIKATDSSTDRTKLAK